MNRKKVVVLGSTGSIGTQALDVIASHGEAFEVLALSAYASVEMLNRQIAAHAPQYVGLSNEQEAGALIPGGYELFCGEDANSILASLPQADVVLIAVSGMAGLPALLAALKANKVVALANKESIVCGNALVQRALQEGSGKILPVDSEHSAIFQCLQNGAKSEVASLVLTASGGPFWQCGQEELAAVRPEQALRHPVWRMGKKITIDSATLMNKALEVIEASFLFDTPKSHISVLIHPQSIVHSMVEYRDGTVIAQLSLPDMRLAIQYALGYPARIERRIERLSLAEIGKLTFFEAGHFPAIRLAKEALSGEDVLPILLNAANDAAVESFLEYRIGFLDILHTIEYVMERAPRMRISSFEDVQNAYREGRRIAEAYRQKNA